MISEQKIKEIVEEKIKGTDFFLVEALVKPGNNIKVSIDNKNRGVFINDCVEVSRHIESNLNRDLEDFKLEVFSAGLEEPFKVKQQYFKNLGKKVEVITYDGLKHEGTLLMANEETIMIEKKVKNKKAKKTETENIEINYNNIKQTKQTIYFK